MKNIKLTLCMLGLLTYTATMEATRIRFLCDDNHGGTCIQVVYEDEPPEIYEMSLKKLLLVFDYDCKLRSKGASDEEVYRIAKFINESKEKLSLKKIKDRLSPILDMDNREDVVQFIDTLS